MTRRVGRVGRSRTGRLRAAAWLGRALAAVLVLASASWAVEELRFFRIGTAATTGTYFQIGGVLASAISKPSGSRECERGGSCGVPGLVAVAQATQGSIQNVLAVGSGQLESALVQADVAYWAYSGGWVAARRCSAAKSDPGKAPGAGLLKSRGPIRDLRAIAALYPEDLHIVVRAESEIHTLRDLKGKRVALGEPESGTLADARLVLDAAGMSECDIKAAYLGLAEAADALAQGRTDAFFMVGGYPVPAIADIAAGTALRLLPIPHDIAQRLAQKYPFFSIDAIPAGVYAGLDSDTPTIGTMALWMTRTEIDEGLVYAITKSLWSDATRRLLDATHPAGRRIRVGTSLDGLAIPLHPGAARYYREMGVRVPDGL